MTKILIAAGVGDIVGVDSRGALHTGREDYVDGSMNPMKRWYAETTNPQRRDGDPAALLEGTDLLIGVSGAEVVPAEALGRMNPDPMVFAMANPTPEVSPEEAVGRRADNGDRALRLPEPDQQRARLPRHLPRRARRARARRSPRR